jgi:putative peptidoglycan lipid II flippase
VRETAGYFAVYSVSLFLWSAQAIYARAFYAAGNTLVPMIAGTVITFVSLPIYTGLYHWQGAFGLAMASDTGIAIQTLTLAVLLHRRRMVSLASLDLRELGRCVVAGLAAGVVVSALIAGVGRVLPWTGRWMDAGLLVVGAGIWVGVAGWVLERAGSALPRVALRRLGWK